VSLTRISNKTYIIDQLPEEVKVKIEQPLTQRKKYVPIKKVRLEMVRLMLG
jgi:hypothetical protein